MTGNPTTWSRRGAHQLRRALLIAVALCALLGAGSAGARQPAPTLQPNAPVPAGPSERPPPGAGPTLGAGQDEPDRGGATGSGDQALGWVLVGLGSLGLLALPPLARRH